MTQTISEDMKPVKVLPAKTGSNVEGKYLAAAVIGIAALALLLKRHSSNSKPSAFKKYILPVLMATAYKKLTGLVEQAYDKKQVSKAAGRPPAPGL